jgi:hypothetical protein
MRQFAGPTGAARRRRATHGGRPGVGAQVAGAQQRHFWSRPGCAWSSREKSTISRTPRPCGGGAEGIAGAEEEAAEEAGGCAGGSLEDSLRRNAARWPRACRLPCTAAGCFVPEASWRGRRRRACAGGCAPAARIPPRSTALLARGGLAALGATRTPRACLERAVACVQQRRARARGAACAALACALPLSSDHVASQASQPGAQLAASGRAVCQPLTVLQPGRRSITLAATAGEAAETAGVCRGAFFNREAELQSLIDGLADEPTAVLVMIGPPSCGKSGARSLRSPLGVQS